MERNIAANLWAARLIPVVLAGVVGYATYVLVVPLCVDYLLKKHDDKSATIPILVTHFILFLLMTSSFFRLVYVTTLDPPYLPLGPRAVRDKKKGTKEIGLQSKEGGIGGAEYDSGTSSGDTARDIAGSSSDPDSPGLELFYTKDVFVCEMDGKPRWCSECMNWKPDRTHHCSSSGRCIQKMDHFCPWVGGPVGENNFKFFVQFTGYTALFTLHLLIVMSIYIWKQNNREDEEVNRHFAATLALAGFFLLFTAGMTGTSFELILRNLTQVERLGIKTRLQTLAVLEPPREVLFQINPTLASRPEYYEITYPLGTGKAPSEDQGQIPEGRPRAKSYMHAQRPICSQDIRIESRLSEISHVTMETNLQSLDPKLEAASSPDGLKGAQAAGPHYHRELVSDRDLLATRTFAILNVLQPGDNPWDLGSAIANWESVMGYTTFDYFLPMRRSPCCNHENSESHYMIGPTVDRLRSSVGFLAAEDIQERGQRLKKQRGDSRRQTDNRKTKVESRAVERIDRQADQRLAQCDSATKMGHLNSNSSAV